MEHVVFFTGAEGVAQYRRTPSLEEAVRFVEHLRNVEGVEDSRVYALTEVPLQFKTVYRVEIPGQTDVAPLPPLPPMPAMPELDVPADAAPAEPEAAMAAVPGEPYEAQPEPVSNGKPGSRGMGFFSR